MKKTIFALFLVSFFILPNLVLADGRNAITDWYIQDFQSEIIVNKDSSLTITEKITADCGNLSGKHGIFRVLPTQINTTDRGTIKTPIKLISIADFTGTPYNYTQSNDNINHTLTWKIGDANKTVHGVNHYLIRYRVENAIRTENVDFDEFYWNLNGNFWDIETDHFAATIKFPEEINQKNTQVDYYTGALNSKSKNLAIYQWTENGTLQFTSTDTLKANQGITTSITFPKNIFTPYQSPPVSPFEKFSWLLIFILPIIILSICFLLWNKYGDDPKWDKTIIPEFEIPENLTPLELGVLKTNGTVDPTFITASIINFAVKGIISIEETETKGFLKIFSGKELIFNLKDKNTPLNAPEKMILEMIFTEGLMENKMSLTEVKNRMQFDTAFPKELEKAVIKDLSEKNLITKAGNTAKKIMLPFGIVMVISSIFATIFGFSSYNLILTFISIGIFPAGIIVVIFSFLMPKRTLAGTEVNWKIKGFKLYMKTAEEYRQQFNEKENIFEKFLPYAIVFGMTKLWTQKMEKIYGKDYFSTYHPAWYIGGSLANFDADSFTNQLNSISSSISSVSSSASGAGGGGFSGGGGGGGGGGGW